MWLACESPRVVTRARARENEPSVSRARGERARLSVRVRGLLGRRGGVCRRQEPPRDESGLRAHGSDQRFHRLLGHAVARALTTAPSLAGLGPAAPRILIHHGWRHKGPPGTLSHKPRWGEFSCARVTTPRFLRRSNQSGDVLDGREMALHGVGQIGDCAPIQWPVVYATTTDRCGSLTAFGADMPDIPAKRVAIPRACRDVRLGKQGELSAIARVGSLV